MLTYSLLYLLAAPAPETLETAQARIDAATAQNARQAESKLVKKTQRADTYACAEYPDGRHRFPARCARRMDKISQNLAQVDKDPPRPADAVEAAQRRLYAASELIDAAEKRAAALPKLADAEKTAKDATDKKTAAVTAAETAKSKAATTKTNAEAAMAAASANNTTTLAQGAIDAKKRAEAAATAVETANELVETTTAEAIKAAKIVAQVKASDKAMLAATGARKLAETARTDATAAQEAETKWLEADRKASTGDPAAKRDAMAKRKAADEANKKAKESLAAADTALDDAHAVAKLADAPDAPGAPAAEAKIDEADRKTDAEKQLDALKAGKLIRWGITAGVGPAFFQPLHSANGTRSVPGVGAVTYVMFHPGYWQNAPAQNIYCANRWAGVDSETAASRAADDAAKERAGPIVERVLVAEKAGILDAEEVVSLVCPNRNCATDAEQIRALARKANTAERGSTHYEAALTELVQRHTLSWRTGIAGRCWGRSIGFWVGYPIKYTATVPYEDSKGTIKRSRFDVTPIAAFGLALSPNAYISILAGISLGKINLPPDKDNDDEFVASFLLGLGGNLDFIGLLTKKGS